MSEKIINTKGVECIVEGLEIDSKQKAVIYALIRGVACSVESAFVGKYENKGKLTNKLAAEEKFLYELAKNHDPSEEYMKTIFTNYQGIKNIK